jgi:hypothetical protein
MICTRCTHAQDDHNEGRYECAVCECRAFVFPVPANQRPLLKEFSMNAGRWP